MDMFSLDSNAMCDRHGNVLKHFTPFISPYTDGVDAFAQVYAPEENYYAFPPFCLLPTVIRFVIQEQINCILLIPVISPLPPWFTVVMAKAVAVGYIGDRGVILFPSKTGFKPDNQGLKWTLVAARISFKSHKSDLPAFSAVSFRSPSRFTPVLIISDSMLRFLENINSHVRVQSVGGAKLLDTLTILTTALEETSVFLVLIHSGTNDINKVTKP